MAWKDLSVRDRAGFIRQMVSLGITKSKDQELFYNNSISGPKKDRPLIKNFIPIEWNRHLIF